MALYCAEEMFGVLVTYMDKIIKETDVPETEQ